MDIHFPVGNPVDNFGTVVGENPTPYGILALWAVNGLSIVYWEGIIIELHSLGKQGDNAFGSVRLSVGLFVCILLAEPFDLLPVESEEFVCVSVTCGHLWIIARMRSIGFQS